MNHPEISVEHINIKFVCDSKTGGNEWQKETCICAKCLRQGEPFFSRVMPMGYFCRHCGEEWTE
jgi:hypothetical protein